MDDTSSNDEEDLDSILELMLNADNDVDYQAYKEYYLEHFIHKEK